MFVFSNLLVLAWLAASPIPQNPARGYVVASGGGVPVFANSYTNVVSTSVSTLTIANVAPAGSSRAITLDVTWGAGTPRTISSVKFNTTETFTVIQTVNWIDTSGNTKVAQYILVAPTATTASVVITWSGAIDEAGAVARTFTSVNQTTATAGATSDFSATTRGAITPSVTSTANDLIVDMVGYYQGAAEPWVMGSGQGISGYADNNGSASAITSTKAGAATTTSLSWTPDANVVFTWAGYALKGL
jgi:hypothetical protein